MNIVLVFNPKGLKCLSKKTKVSLNNCLFEEFGLQDEYLGLRLQDKKLRVYQRERLTAQVQVQNLDLVRQMLSKCAPN